MTPEFLAKCEYFPAMFGHSLIIRHLTKFSIMLVNKVWWVMPDWNNPNIVRVQWMFNPLYNTSLVRKRNV